MKKNKIILLFVIGLLFAGTQFVVAQEDKKKVEKVETEIEMDADDAMEMEIKKEVEVKTIKEKPVDAKIESQPNRVNGEGTNKKEVEIIEEEDLEDDDDGSQKIIGKRVDE
ncbi:hypothetical protein [Lacinutrix sp. 5H-3-7-4]|uniref:hypothetical protein n=1 Tax=Lacinutrix sp. (strain 5H-3-7-4) TaxID=983544 RepID=UPI00020A3B2A|nr:hypothetical protein [Lacinutrix sp. 5H-3-7-4]AEH02755.1 hypothetical protein Lacal_2917 [Lacinutrix sp. 5H-3-7-4]